jgi:Filamentous haemagglutinin family outer membrane protein
VPSQDPTKSNVILSAPHGTVDFGAAGVRSANDLNVVALQILNAFNVDVGGTAVGVPTFQAPDVGGLTQSSNTAGAAVKDAAAAPAQSGAGDQPSIIIVEVIGYGGGDGEEEEKKRTRGERHSYDMDSPFQVIGAGSLNVAAGQYLTETEKRVLGR